MGVINWIFYIVCGIVFYFIIDFLDNKYNLEQIDKIVLSNILMLFTAGLCVRFGWRFNENIFLIFAFMMITDVIFNTYVADKDFFNRDENNILYYIVLIIIGFIINQEFFNHVTAVFLTGNDIRIVVWLLVIIYLYNFIKGNKMLNKYKDKSGLENKISINSILTSYAKLKYLYYDDCDCDNKDISNILYAIMIYENNKRNKFLRNYDAFIFRISGKKCKLGIMQVESKKIISDSESINIVYKKIVKLCGKNKSCDYYKLIDDYYGYDNKSVKNIFDIIKKF